MKIGPKPVLKIKNINNNENYKTCRLMNNFLESKDWPIFRVKRLANRWRSGPLKS